ncbi:MAG: AAA family ATPase, partial [Candidatus Lokiarchaeota archaeon]|nr:AAA family ATPase [Candidatus Lokiarchaeota archaeon]
MSHRDSELTFNKDFYTIIGSIVDTTKSNGSGKSSIPNGIGYALYGDSFLEIKNDDVIHNDEKTMSVEYSFSLNNINYKITRNLSRGRTPVI